MSGYAPKTIGLFCKEGCKWCNIAALKWARDEHVYNNQIQDLIHALHQQRDPKALDRIMNMSLTGMPYPVKKDGSINYGDDN